MKTVKRGLPSLKEREISVRVNLRDLVLFLFEGNGNVNDRFHKVGFVKRYSDSHVILSNLSTVFPNGEKRDYSATYKLFHERETRIYFDEVIDYKIITPFICVPNSMPL